MSKSVEIIPWNLVMRYVQISSVGCFEPIHIPSLIPHAHKSNFIGEAPQHWSWSGMTRRVVASERGVERREDEGRHDTHRFETPSHCHPMLSPPEGALRSYTPQDPSSFPSPSLPRTRRPTQLPCHGQEAGDDSQERPRFSQTTTHCTATAAALLRNCAAPSPFPSPLPLRGSPLQTTTTTQNATRKLKSPGVTEIRRG